MRVNLVKEDVQSVANSINVVLTDEQIVEVLRMYPYDQKLDPTATWDLVIENIIYTLIN